jgi:aspartyl aminopeptidase
VALKQETVDKLREQIRQEGFVELTALSAYMALWGAGNNGIVITNSNELSAVECDDIVRVTNGIDVGYTHKDSKFYRKYIAPQETARVYKEAIHEAQELKRPWWKKLLGLK